MSYVRVVVADDHPIIRFGVVSILNKSAGEVIVGEAEDGKQLLQQVIALKPDIALVDISMPGLDGIETLKKFSGINPNTRSVVFSCLTDPNVVRQAFAAGARGYVCKGAPGGELLTAISEVHAGRRYLDPRVSAQILAEESNEECILSDRESEVLRLMVLGHTSKEIASEFNLSAKTVETYRARAMQKLRFSSRAEAVSYAIQRGWLK